MKHSAAILGILILFLLSGCRPGGDTGSGATPPVQLPVSTPAVSADAEEPEQSQPEETYDRPQGGEQPPDAVQPSDSAAPTFLSAEELTAYAAEWSETYASRFVGFSAFHIDPAYWFAEYPGGAAAIAFTARDGEDGSISFLPADGLTDAAAAAAQLLGQDTESIILVDRPALLEEMARRMAAMAEENLTEDAALDAFLKNAQYAPALTQDMWYCVGPEETGYILMAYGNAYRLQRMAAMTQYADTPTFRVRPAFDRALEAYGWFDLASMSFDREDSVTEAETDYYRVNEPGIGSMLELRTYLKTLFSDEIVDELLGLGYYRDVDGVLYTAAFAGDPVPVEGPATVTQESPTRVVYHMGADYVYEQVGEQWLFTQFPAPQ